MAEIPLIVQADTSSVARGKADLAAFKNEFASTAATVKAGAATAATGTAKMAAQTDAMMRQLRAGTPGATGLARSLGEIGAEAATGGLSVAGLTSRLVGASAAFGAVGLAVSVLLPVVIAIGQAFFETENQAEVLEERMKALKDVVGNATDALKESRRTISDLRSDYGSLAPEVQKSLTLLAELSSVSAIEGIRTEVDNLGDSLGNLQTIFRTGGTGLTGLTEATQRLQDEFGMTRSEADRTVRALRALNDAEGPAEAARATRELADALADAYPNAADIPPELRAVAEQTARAVVEIGLLQGATEDTSAAVELLRQKVVEIGDAIRSAASGDLSAPFARAFPNATALLRLTREIASNMALNYAQAAAYESAQTGSLAAQYQSYGQGRVAGERLARESSDLYGGNRVIPFPSTGTGSAGGGGGGSTRDAYSEQQVELVQRLAAAERERAALLGGQDMERYAAIQQALNAAQGEGVTLTEEQTAAITEQASAVFDLEKNLESLKSAYEAITAAGEQFGSTMGKALADAAFGFGDLRDAARAAFQDMVTSILQELGKLAASKMLQMILGGAGGGFSLNLGGLGIPMLAAGGYVTRPTLAVVGEAGPEAVVPLSRGPEAMGAFGKPQMTVNVSNQMGGQAEVETRQTDANTLEVIIRATEQRVADGITRGTGRVSRSMQDTFGLTRRGR
jgi:archaellum component FlaC